MIYEAMRQLLAAERKIAGAQYDLSRPDKHPNDLHKALRKMEEAEALIRGARDEIGVGVES